MNLQGVTAPAQTAGTSSTKANIVINDTSETLKKEIERINTLFYGLVVFIAITFIVEIATMNLDRIKDKDIYLNYNDLVEKYTSKNIELQLKLQEQEYKISKLQEELANIKK